MTSLGRYELLLELARGGMAELFLGRLRGAGGFAKLVAIKRILPHLAQEPQFHEMFLNEGRIAAQLSHPNVCQVFELGEAGGALFLAMEYLDGVAWDHLIAAAPREAALALAAGVLGQAAEGLHYAHTLRDALGRATPVVHRDVSPQNLFVTVDGACKVLDFGVSKMMTDGPRTRSGVIKGKLPYMAPEQIRGEPIDARTDVFSLGVCAWEAFAGARLFDRETDFLIWKAITEEEVPPIASRWPACPPLVDAVVRRALAREPSGRQTSARGFADELRNAAGGGASPGEIAAAVRSLCGDRLADAARRVAAAVSAPAGAPALEQVAVAQSSDGGDGGGMQLRRASVAIRRDGPAGDTAADDAAPTRDFAAANDALAPRPGLAATDDAAPTRDFAAANDALAPRPGLAAADDAAPTRDFATADRAPAPPVPPQRGRRRKPHRRSHLVTAIVAGGAAAAITAIVVVMVTRGSRGAPASSAPTAADPPPDASSLAPAFEAIGRLKELKQDLTRLRETLAPLSGAVTSAASSDDTAAAPADDTATDQSSSDPAAAAAPGTYVVDSNPRATIYADGKRLGATPLRAPLPAGKHAIRAVLADGRERSFEIEIEAEKELRPKKLTW